MQSLEPSKRRILIIDDNQSIHDDYRKILDSANNTSHEEETAMAAFFGDDVQGDSVDMPDLKIEVDSAMQGQEGLAMVEKAMAEGHPYSLAFVDIRMPPGWDGLKTIGEIWQVAPDLQVVICSAYSDNSFQEICAKLGRCDSLLILKKPFEAVEVYQIAVAMTEKWILSRRARLRQEDLEKLVLERTLKLEQASLEDPLTRIANRTKFNSVLGEALKRTRRHKTMTGLMLIDVDYFKEINDSHGHPAGDELLIQVAQRLSSSVRETDTVARLGGDEFGIVQPEARNTGEFRIVLERVEEELGQPFDLEGKQVNCKFSIGVAIAPTDSDQAEELMKRADVALYRSKNSGRDCSSFYEPEMDHELVKTREVIADLSGSVENGELQLYYQPIYSCKNWRLVTHESLLRWNHPEHGLLGPDAFLPAAEESGLIVELGKWVVQEATRTAVKWPNGIRVAVNLSPVQFHPKFDVFEMIMSCLAESGLAPNRLEVEITENVLLRDFDMASATINKLREAGVSIVLDDFGIGHSSLNYLKSFAFDKIKLDRSFVWGAETCDKSAAILNSVASLGKELGIHSTAEGIETASQLDRVVSAGFSEVQGYFFAKPSPIPILDEINVEKGNVKVARPETDKGNVSEAGVFPEVIFNRLSDSSNTEV